jgi:ArsR family transcriptional regulator
VTAAVRPIQSLRPPRRGQRRWELYRLLADAARLRLLALTAAEELAVSELAELLGLGQPKVSRHLAALREAGLLLGRKHGTWLLLRLDPRAKADAVIADALEAGRELCAAEGLFDRIEELVSSRDQDTREFFAKGGRPLRVGPPPELAAYLRPLATLIGERRLCIDAGTGDGALLEVLAPLYEHVVAVDRSAAQLELARQRAAERRFKNVRFVCGELDGPEVRRAAKEPADAVLAARVLHHAPVPARALAALVGLARPPAAGSQGGAVIVIDYERHADETLRAREADLWLGFGADELEAMAREAGLEQIVRGRLPQSWRGDGPDRHLGWQWLAGRRKSSKTEKKR